MAPHDEPSTKLRLSIDFHSIKNTLFKGLIYFKHDSVSNLKIPKFKTSSQIEIQNQNEKKIEDGFRSYVFPLPSNELEFLERQNISLECWHKNINDDDDFVGICQIQMLELAKSPNRQFEDTFVKTLNKYYELLNKNNKKVADVNIILYLEDLGPNYEEEPGILDNEAKQINIQIQKPKVNFFIQNLLQQDLQQLEFNIIWELEQWQKTQRNNFLQNQNEKQEKYITELNLFFKQQDIYRQKLFDDSLEKYSQIESRLKHKDKELQKRESKIILLEEEMDHKLSTTKRKQEDSKIEIQSLQKQTQEQKQSLEKENKKIQSQIDIIEKQIKESDDEMQKFKKDQLKSPQQLVKNQISQKDQEIKMLEKELIKATDSKNQYQNYYEQLKEETVNMQHEYDQYKLEQQKMSYEQIQDIKHHLSSMPSNQDDHLLNQLKNDLQLLKQQTEKPQQNIQNSQQNDEDLTEKEILEQERDHLLSIGYTYSDKLIQQYNDKIYKMNT